MFMHARCVPVFMMTALLALTGPVLAADVVVAPDGDDAQPGTARQPVATLQAAVERVRAIRKDQPQRAEPVIVEVRGGRYELREPVTLTHADSGTEDSPTIYRAAPDQRPVFSGGRIIDGWTVGADGVWRTTLEPVKAGAWNFRELFVDGQRRIRARHPNRGWVRVEQIGPDARTSFTFAAGDVPLDAAGEATELVFLHDWSISRIRVKSIDPATRTLVTTHPVGCSARHYAMDWFEKQPRYALENHPAFLDEPGEWYLNAQTGELAYLPMAGESPEKSTVIAPAAEALLVAAGEPGKPIEHVRFEGLAFEHCLFNTPANGYASGQAAFHEARDGSGGNELRQFMPAALTVEFARNVVLSDCHIERVGGTALWLRAQTFNCAVERCRVADAAGNGVMIGEGQRLPPEQTATGNALRDSTVVYCGRVFYGAVGVWVGITRETVIEHNEIAHHPYTGVSIGWVWNPTPTSAQNNRITHNHIHHVMQTLSDGGGIYSLGRQPGSVLAHNLIHDVPLNAGRAESNGMFLDEGTADVVIEHNAIYGIDRSPLRFHKADKNLVRNNVLVIGEGVPPVRYNNTPEAHIELVENNVVPAASFDPAGVDAHRKAAGPR